MFGTVLRATNKTYRVRFGLNSLIEVEQTLSSIDEVLNSLSSKSDINTIKLLLYYGLNMEYSFKEIEDILEDILKVETIDIIILRLKTAISSSLGVEEGAWLSSSITEQTEELFPIFVGEVGMSPRDFFELTLSETYAVYQGYMRRQENQVNTTLLALRLNLDSNAEAFSLDNELGFKQSTLKEREKTLQDLNLL